MQTIEEYKAYTKQLEGEVGKWHHAYEALMIERNQLVNNLKSTEKFLEAEREECDRWRKRATNLCENKKIIETMAAELDELPEGNEGTIEALQESVRQNRKGDKVMNEQKEEIKALRRAKHSAEAVLRGLQEHGLLDSVTFDGTYTVRFGHTTIHGVA